jgi:hypothetical protein
VRAANEDVPQHRATPQSARKRNALPSLPRKQMREVPVLQKKAFGLQG